MSLHRSLVLPLGLLLLAPAGAAPPPATPESPLPSIADRTKGMERRDGFLPLYWDERKGRVFLEIARLGDEILYYTSLPAGIGSNYIGLDRGQVGDGRIVRFDRIGPKVLLSEVNYGFRSSSSDPVHRRAVADSFATSVLAGFEVVAERGSAALVDATDFVLHDAHGVAARLAATQQGKYALDAARSAPRPEGMRSFPENTELEATLTFTTGEPAGDWIRGVTPDPGAVTVREHQSFVQLPGPGFRPRPADPRSGYNVVSYADHAAPLGAPLVQSLAARHRLVKRHPGNAPSEPVEPIVYYVDRGAPEPIRAALIEGASWWSAAFEKVGFEKAFRVELLPLDADPMDARYNVIQWVHRATRGWSYGASIVDPRTGEIVKGHVTLGSLRVRQDYLLAEGLLAPYKDGDEDPPELSRMALARIRQLAAHEVGHTLGLDHNFLGSAFAEGGRASVMDYPHPRTRLLADGSIDLSDAYGAGIGAWDEVAIAWGYSDFPPGTDEPTQLARILSEARARGLDFLDDRDARPYGSAHPRASLWDNGGDAAAELDRVLDVRRAALARFGENAIRRGRPLATIEEALVPLYLHHRYQTVAAAKAIGGVDYGYALRGDGREPQRPVPAAAQERALAAVLRTLRPDELAIPTAILARIPPRPAGYDATRELFARHTGVVFDPLAPAEAAAAITVSALLDPDRAARLVTQTALDPRLPGLDTVLDRLTRAAFDRAAKRTAYEAEIARAIRPIVVNGILALAGRGPMPQVQALARAKLTELRGMLSKPAGTEDAAERASSAALAARIDRFLEGKEMPGETPALPTPPPGEPIGDGE